MEGKEFWGSIIRALMKGDVLWCFMLMIWMSEQCGEPQDYPISIRLAFLRLGAFLGIVQVCSLVLAEDPCYWFVSSGRCSLMSLLIAPLFQGSSCMQVGRVLLTPWPGFPMKASPEESELHAHSNFFRGWLALVCVWGIFCSKNVFRPTEESLWIWQSSCHISTLKWDMLKKKVEKYWKAGIKENISCPCCCCSVAQWCPTLCDPMNCSTPGFLVLHHLLDFAQTHVHWVSDAIQPSHPLSPPSPPAFGLSQNQGLFSESVLRIRWPKCWSFSFSISPPNQYSELISFRMDWLDLLAVQGILKSLLQHHSSKASILQRSAFFTVQLSHPYMTTRKIIVLTRWTFVGKVMSLLFTMLSRLVTTFLPKGKRLLISWLQSPSKVIFEPPQNKICHCFHCFSI